MKTNTRAHPVQPCMPTYPLAPHTWKAQIRAQDIPSKQTNRKPFLTEHSTETIICEFYLLSTCHMYCAS